MFLHGYIRHIRDISQLCADDEYDNDDDYGHWPGVQPVSEGDQHHWQNLASFHWTRPGRSDDDDDDDDDDNGEADDDDDDD